MVGSIVGPILADRLGRRATCLLACALTLASWLTLGLGQSGLVAGINKTKYLVFWCFFVILDRKLIF